MIAAHRAIVLKIVALCFVSLAQPVQSSEQPVRVELGFEDAAGLISVLKAEGYEAALGEECCDQSLEEAQGVWIGEDVPYADVKRIVDLALSKYPHLRYYKFFDSKVSDEWRRLIYIGGSKWAAHENTKSLGSDEARAVFGKVSSSQDLQRLIRSLHRCTQC